MKLLFVAYLLLFFHSALGQKTTTVVYNQETHLGKQSIEFKDKNEVSKFPKALTDQLSDIISGNLIFTRTYIRSHDTIYLSVIHSPQKNTKNIPVDIDAKPSYRIFYKGKFYLKENGRYVDDKSHNISKSHLLSTGKTINFLNYDCGVFTDKTKKNIYYITQDLKQNINPLFLQFDNLQGAIIFARQYNDDNTGNYMVLTATSIK